MRDIGPQAGEDCIISAPTQTHCMDITFTKSKSKVNYVIVRIREVFHHTGAYHHKFCTDGVALALKKGAWEHGNAGSFPRYG